MADEDEALRSLKTIYRTNRHRELEAERRHSEKLKRIARRKNIRRNKGHYSRAIPIVAPSKLDFGDNFESTIRFLEQIRRTAKAGGHTMLILLRRCVELAPEVALVLAAEIERCLHHRPKTINGNNPRETEVAAMLRDIGFHKMLKFHEPRVESSPVATTYVKMKSGIQGGGQHADDLRELVLGDATRTSDKLRDDMISGLNEAMLNVHHHAYDETITNSYDPMPNKRWWIAGYRNATRKEIGFIAFDQGVGIPSTLPKKHSEIAADILSAAAQVATGSSPSNDHLLIARAFEVGRSRTGKSSQGRGLNDFKKLLEAAGGKASLQVLSGRGSYLYNQDGSEETKPLPLPFHGTLIVWRLTDSPAVQWDEAE